MSGEQSIDYRRRVVCRWQRFSKGFADGDLGTINDPVLTGVEKASVRTRLLQGPRVKVDDRLAATIALGIFATGVAASLMLILAHDRPFTGEISIRPDPLVQVMPE